LLAEGLLQRLTLNEPPEVPLEDPQLTMNHFYAQLLAVGQGRDGQIARVAFYSDSLNGNDVVSSELRHALQDLFGDGGKGWIPIAPGWPTQKHKDVQWRANPAWTTRVVNRSNAPHDRYGLGGVLSLNTNSWARAQFATAQEGSAGRLVSHVQLYYQAWQRGGEVALQIDGNEPVVVATEAPDVEDRVLTVDVEDGPHEINVTAPKGPVRLYGVVMERDGPGVVVDGLMLVGARSRRLGNFAPAHWGRQVQFRQPDLLLFWLGANDDEANRHNVKTYLQEYGQGIAHARAGRPNASCLVVSVADQGEAPRGLTAPRIPALVAGQRDVAQAQGCAFFNLFEAMGGENSIRRWYRATPRLAGGDFLHLTPDGSRKVALLINQALIQGFAQYVQQKPATELAQGQTDGTGGTS
jgi:lysophospholipase L1-like esterase